MGSEELYGVGASMYSKVLHDFSTDQLPVARQGTAILPAGRLGHLKVSKPSSLSPPSRPAPWGSAIVHFPPICNYSHILARHGRPLR